MIDAVSYPGRASSVPSVWQQPQLTRQLPRIQLPSPVTIGQVELVDGKRTRNTRHVVGRERFSPEWKLRTQVTKLKSLAFFTAPLLSPWPALPFSLVKAAIPGYRTIPFLCRFRKEPVFKSNWKATSHLRRFTSRSSGSAAISPRADVHSTPALPFAKWRVVNENQHRQWRIGPSPSEV